MRNNRKQQRDRSNQRGTSLQSTCHHFVTKENKSYVDMRPGQGIGEARQVVRERMDPVRTHHLPHSLKRFSLLFTTACTVQLTEAAINKQRSRIHRGYKTLTACHVGCAVKHVAQELTEANPTEGLCTLAAGRHQLLL